MASQAARAAVQRMVHPWGLTEEWIAFIARMEDLYEQLARARGEPYVRHTAEELRAIATLAAALGLHPEEAAAQAGGTDERELTLGGIG
jgi:hypothetical protein